MNSSSMKFFSIYLLMFLGCGSAVNDSNTNQSSGSLTTKHFAFTWNVDETSAEEIEYASGFCEKIYTEVANLIGEDRMPEGRIQVSFKGEGMQTNGRKIPPNVDSSGRINLYRFRQGGYLDAFAHELVHAIRINSIPNWERFFEEGFASAIADVVYPEKTGFPLFGYERSKITSYLMQQDYFISLSEMRLKHRELNLRCQLQTYIPREDFFCYLRETYGTEKLLEFSNSNRTNEIGLYEEIWKKSFDELETEWEKYTLELHSAEEVMRIGEEYFEKTSAKYIPICR